MPLRSHTEKNLKQHATFLREFPLGDRNTAEAIQWFKTLPLFKEFKNFRVVHACWDEQVISKLSVAANQGTLSDEQFILAANTKNPLFAPVETVTKGPELALPPGFVFKDKDGTERSDIRVKWWSKHSKTWSDIAMSVPEPERLPKSVVPSESGLATYPASAKPVFFGHYWLTGRPQMQSENALCLDYSAGKSGPLLAYRFEDDDHEGIDVGNIVG